MSNEKILFIVEGEKEKKLIKIINKIYGMDYKISFYNNGTTIYELIDEYHKESATDEFLDFALFLREHTKDEKLRKTLSKKYSLTYLIFDFDPHYSKYSFEGLSQIQTFFSSSLEEGLLLISYPMLEAFHHLKKNDNRFLNLTVSQDEIFHYKDIVGQNSDYTDYTQYNHESLNYLFSQNIKRIKYLFKKTNESLSKDDLEKIIVSSEFIEKQNISYQENQLLVVSTIFYYIVDLLGEGFYLQLELD